MYATCLFCYSRLGTNDAIEAFPVGRRLAFDAARGRLWVVCPSCGRWNLSPLEERWDAIESCERLFVGTRLRVTTAEIGLARLSDRFELVRIGKPLRPEFAAWRYGSRFRRRRRHTRVMAASAVAVAGLGGITLAPLFLTVLSTPFAVLVLPGLSTVAGAVPVLSALAVREYFEHDRVVGRLVRNGKLLSVRACHAREAELRVVGRDTAAVTLDVPHDGGWAHFDGLEALQAASTLLAGANQFGASATEVQQAVQRVEAHGDAAAYLRAASTLNGARGGRLMSLLNDWRGFDTLHLSSTECLALEMTLHEESERHALEGELALLEAAWREAEEIASLADDL